MGHNKPPYYLTAYGLAAKEGFKGTLEEWLASLHGDGVQMRYQDGKLQYRIIKGAEEPDPEEGWQDLLDVEGTRQEIFGAAQNEAIRAEEAAVRSEGAADRAEAGGASTFYNTLREELGDAYTDTEKYKSAYIYGLYDALMAKYPNNVQKNEVHNDDGTFTNYEYVISTGEYAEGLYNTAYGNNPPIKKTKYLVLSGIHGDERRAVYSTYRFIHDVLGGRNVPTAFREGAIISVMPVGTPSAFDAFSRKNGNNVDINRNFDADAAEKETQAIQNWLSANSDAELFIDCHNNGALNEKVLILGLPDNSLSNTARKIALRGVDRIIPFWRDVIGYPDKVKACGLVDTDGDGSKVEYRDVIYSYSATIDMAGLALSYAQEVLGISSIALETAPFYGDHTDFDEDMKADSPEAVAMGAEALGNILIEFYTHSCEVMNMADIDSKLDTLIQSARFRIVKGSFTPEADTTEISLDIPAGLQAIEIKPQGTPSESVSGRFPVHYAFGVQFTGDNGYVSESTPLCLEYKSTTKMGRSNVEWNTYNGLYADIGAGLVFEAGMTYNYTAYYWDE